MLNGFFFPFLLGPNLHYEVRDGVGVVKIDMPNSKVNTLTAELTSEFEEMFIQIENDPNVQSVAVVSGKPGCFVAGADIK